MTETEKNPVRLVDVERMEGELDEEYRSEYMEWQKAIHHGTPGERERAIANEPCGFCAPVCFSSVEVFTEVERNEYELFGNVARRYYWNVDLITPEVKRWLSERGIETP